MNEIGLSFVKWLQQFRTPAGEDFFFGITQYSEGIWIIGILGLLFWLFGPRPAYRTGFGLFVGNLVVGTVKNLFRIERPWIRDPSIVPVERALPGAYGYSFPSGHTGRATLLWGGMAASFRRWWLWIPVLLWIGLVAWSRMVLGCHTPLDVCAAIIISFLVIWGMGWVYDWTERRPERAWMVLPIVVAVCAVAVILIRWGLGSDEGPRHLPQDGYQAIARLLAFFSAWFIERQYIQYDPKRLGGWRWLAGIGGVAVLWLMMQNLRRLIAPLLGGDAASIVTNAAYPVWIFVVWPFLLKGLENPRPR